jgi:hypothetical protein
MVVNPDQGTRGVLDEDWVFHTRIEPVIGNRSQQAGTGKGLTDGSITGTVAALPTATLKK